MADLEALARHAMQSAVCVPTDRAHWPEICEDRMSRNIVALKAIVTELGMA
jgi:hypothetical protein